MEHIKVFFQFVFQLLGGTLLAVIENNISNIAHPRHADLPHILILCGFP